MPSRTSLTSRSRHRRLRHSSERNVRRIDHSATAAALTERHTGQGARFGRHGSSTSRTPSSIRSYGRMSGILNSLALGLLTDLHGPVGHWCGRTVDCQPGPPPDSVRPRRGRPWFRLPTPSACSAPMRRFPAESARASPGWAKSSRSSRWSRRSSGAASIVRGLSSPTSAALPTVDMRKTGSSKRLNRFFQVPSLLRFSERIAPSRLNGVWPAARCDRSANR